MRFPYGDLNTAVEIALIAARHGLDCSQGQLAAGLGVDAGSAPYRARVSAAVTFGLVEAVKNTGVILTPLGRRISDPQQIDSAKADAFLHVELYKKIFTLFDGTVLPADQGLEAQMVKEGVAPKQVTRARQAFARSAEQAGFFQAGRTRLVRPSGVTIHSNESEQSETVPPSSSLVRETSEETIVSNALLAALFKKMLPEEGEQFPARERKRFFRALAVNLDVIYGEPDDGQIDSQAIADLFKEEPTRATGAARVGQEA